MKRNVFRMKRVVVLLALTFAMGAAAQSNLKPRFGLTQKQINHIDTALAWMTKYNYANFNDGIWGGDMEPSKMQLLNRMLTAYELYDLALHHVSPSVRVSAGKIIVERYSQLAPRLVMDLLADSGVFHSSMGCFGYSDFVGSYLLNDAVNKERLSDSLLHIIDSLILTPDYRHIQRRGKLVRQMALTEENHALLLRLWQQERQNGALLKLAAFHYDADTTLVIAALHEKRGKRKGRSPYNYFSTVEAQAIRAIAVWPHDAFKPHLEAIADDNYSNTAFYEAVLAFDTAWAVACIDSVFARLSRTPKNQVQIYAPQGEMTMRAGEALYRAFVNLPHPDAELRRHLWPYMVARRY